MISKARIPYRELVDQELQRLLMLSQLTAPE
jgi:hypothetical protein